MSNLQDYKAWWRSSIAKPLPPASEKCACGWKYRREILSTIKCAKCGHEVLSYSRMEAQNDHLSS